MVRIGLLINLFFFCLLAVRANPLVGDQSLSNYVINANRILFNGDSMNVNASNSVNGIALINLNDNLDLLTTNNGVDLINVTPSNITNLIDNGANITLSGTGVTGDPYVITGSAGGGGGVSSVNNGDVFMEVSDGTGDASITFNNGLVLENGELDSEVELEAQLSDVTDVFTNNDGALDDDDLSDNDTDDLSEGSTNLYYTEVRVSANSDVAANTSARHAAVTVNDTSEIDLTLVGQLLNGTLIAGSIDETKLDASVNASLDLADSALQSEVDGSTTNEIQNLFETVNAPAGTDPVADSSTDTLNFTVDNGLVLIGDSGTDTLAFSIDQTALQTAIDTDTTDHTALSNIGTNTHAQIDTHIADSTIHFTNDGFLENGNNLSDLDDTSTARTNLGVAIGSNVQAYSDNLDLLATNNGIDLINVTPSNITGLIDNGANITLSGTGITGDPYVITGSAGGGTVTSIAISGDNGLTVLSGSPITSAGTIALTIDQGQVLVPSDIGSSVQAHSAVLDATTASFTTTDETKLDNIEAFADVTDATNVNAAGAVMNSDYTPAHSLLVQQSGTGSPSVLTPSNNTVLGKLTGNIVALSATQIRTLINVEDGAEVNNISDVNATDLTDGGDSTLHFHSSDRSRANHTGTQTASTISDFDTEVSNNSDVAANTSARHAAVTVNDTSEIDLTLVGQLLNGTLIAGSIDETKLDTSVNASLDLADSALQSEVDGSTTNEIQNLFETMNAPAGTDPVADSSTDTLNFTVDNGLVLIGDSGTDTLAFSIDQTALQTAIDTDTTDHTALSNIGTNTHVQIDTHIADSSIHTELVDLLGNGAITINNGDDIVLVDNGLLQDTDTVLLSINEANIIITESQISDLTHTTDTFATVDLDGATQSTNAPTLDFADDDFDIVESPADDFDITIDDSGIDHDATTNFVANEHIDHSSVTITTDNGLTGGGDISSSRTFDIDLVLSGSDSDSSTTQSDSGLEFVSSKLTLLRGCSDNQILKWDETEDDWNCEDDTTGGSINSFETISTTSGTNPVADSSTDTLTITAGTGVTVTGDSSADSVTIASTLGTSIDASEIDTDAVGTDELDDDANTPVAGSFVIVETGAASFDYLAANAGTDVTADLEEEAHCSEHDSADIDCSGETIILASDSVDPANLAESDFGDWTVSSDVASLDADVVAESELLESMNFSATGDWDFGGGILQIPNSTTLPATCEVGDSYMDTDATSGQRFYLCESTNTWALQGDGGAGGGATLDITFNALQAKLPTSNPCVISNPAAATVDYLLCDDSTDESVTWSTTLTNYSSGTIYADVYYTMVSATTGKVDLEVSIMCVSDGDSANLDTESFATAGNNNETVPGTAGYMSVLTITPTDDSCAANDLLIVKLNRDANDATNDTATGDVEIRKVRLYE